MFARTGPNERLIPRAPIRQLTAAGSEEETLSVMDELMRLFP
jgi:hypothetical protein